MNKYIKILIFLGILWVASYGLAELLQTQGASISSSDTIAIIPIQGAITLNGGTSLLQTTTSAVSIVKKIEQANNDPNVKGIVLEINSPGGTVLASKQIANAVKSVNKPVVAVITEFGTSGAYWAASQADLIIADELSIVGSIGVIGSYLEFSGLLDSYNVSYQRLITGKYKDISSPLKQMTPEEEVLIQERLNSIHNYFVQDVAFGRNMSITEIELLATGIFYLGIDSMENGLIDELGDKNYGINRTRELAGIQNGKVDEYSEKNSLLSSLIKDYTAYSSFYIGQGIAAFLSTEASQNIEFRV
jgi:protease IV